MPHSDTEIFTRISPQSCLLPIFADVTADLVVCGHTHMQFERQIGGVRVVNAGSVGKPYGKSGAYWLMLGPDVQFRQTSYNLQEAAQQIRATTYPQAESFVKDFIIGSLPEEEALEWLESRVFTGGLTVQERYLRFEGTGRLGVEGESCAHQSRDINAVSLPITRQK